MASLTGFLGDMIHRADTRLVAGWYHAISVSTQRVRAQLRAHGMPFVDPRLDAAPTLGELDRTAEAVIHRARTGAGALSGMAGLVGAVSVPPEVLATMIAVIRMGQRLCIVYGFDPDDDRGQMALCRALAAAYDVDLPMTGPMGLRVSDLPWLVRPDTDPRGTGARLARAVAVRSGWWVAGRITRYVPVLSATSGAVDAQRRTDTAARRMQAVLQRMTEVPGPSHAPLVDAVELPPRLTSS